MSFFDTLIQRHDNKEFQQLLATQAANSQDVVSAQSSTATPSVMTTFRQEKKNPNIFKRAYQAVEKAWDWYCTIY